MGIGFLELVIICVAALVLLGPQRLPDVLRQVARIYVQIRRSSNDLKSAFDYVVNEAEDEMRRGAGITDGKKFLDQIVNDASATPASDREATRDKTATVESDHARLRPVEPFSWGDAPIGHKPTAPDSEG
jgi:sec-independent protein translocase protein TatB